MLGVMLRNRARLTGSTADLAEAIDFVRQAVSLSPPDDPNRLKYLSNLVAVLRTRFDRAADDRDLEEAIRVGTQAAAIFTDDNPDRFRLLSNLGNAFGTRFQRFGDLEDVHEAVSVAREAVAAATAGDPANAMYASNLGATLAERFRRTGDPADLDEAIDLGRQAVAAVPHGDPARAAYLYNLNHAILERFQRDGRIADLDSAVKGFAEACRSHTAAVADRMRAGRVWATLAVLHLPPDQAVEAQAEAIGLLPLLAWRGISYRDQQLLLEEHAPALAADGAAVAAAADRTSRAIELLELGRGVYWSQVLDTRADFDDLHSKAPDLADRLMTCRAALER